MQVLFRAKEKNSNNYVIGYEYYNHVEDEYYITHYVSGSNYKVDRTTRSINIEDMLDNQNKKIFASLSLEGKGGDIVEEYVGDKAYSGTVFIQNGCMELRTDYDGKAKTLIDYAYINEDLGYKGVKIIGIQQ